MNTPLTMQQVANANGWQVKTVRKWRQKLNLGTPFNRTYLLTEADAKEIARHIREKRGNPNFGNTAKTKAKR
jgi:hypothetical protein